MSLRSLLRHRVMLAFGAVLVVAACVISSNTHGESQPTSAPTVVRSPMKVHMFDGSIVVFTQGGTIGGGQVAGHGLRYEPTLKSATATTMIPLDSVVGVETYDRTVNQGRTFLYSTVATAATLVGALAAAVAIFGSCPTIYADSAGTSVLQAESFSYSIAPLLEKRDVDRLNVVSDASGVVRVEVRNEALESHYIDQLELLEVRHASDELVLPAARAGIVAVRGATLPAAIRDRAGRDLRDVLGTADDRAFATDSSTLAGAARGDNSEDFIDIVVPKERGRDSIAVVLRARSSLLTTMLFYDQMLAGQGASALDYVGYDLQHVTKVAQLARWYVNHLGLRVSVLTNGGRDEQQIVRLVDFGPAAWRDVAAIVPAPADGDSVHIRLTFLADEFRIDRVLVSTDMRAVEPRSILVSRVLDGDDSPRPDVRDLLQKADDRRLQTWPGQRFVAEYDVGRETPGMKRTYFIAAQGYYVEWMRGRWLTANPSPKPFTPWSAPVAPILQRWLQTRDSLEATFFRQRVPIV